LLSTITVTTNLEHEDGKVSLREAIDTANEDPGFDSIDFDPTLSGLPIQLSQGELLITATVEITGLGAPETVIDAQQTSRVFEIGSDAGDVSLSKMTITGGKTTDEDEPGAGIFSRTSGTLRIVESTISGNTTTAIFSNGAGLYVVDGDSS